LLSSINEFLDDSVVLPPGDFESKNLLSIDEIQDMRKRRQERKQLKKAQEEEERKSAAATEDGKTPVTASKAEDGGKGGKDGEDGEKPGDSCGDPLVRTKRPFGGVINDFKRRFPFYLSDITDGISMQVLSTGLFIYFACLAPAIAFGGLYGEQSSEHFSLIISNY
jgi:hypothetical protein